MTEYIDLTAFDGQELFSIDAPQSEWICFELTQEKLLGCWDDDQPYVWINTLGYAFNHAVGFHFDVFTFSKEEKYVPGNPGGNSRLTQIWMPVVKV